MNIIDTLKRAAEALDRASKVMDPEAQAFQDRALADLRGTIAELESAELPEPELSIRIGDGSYRGGWTAHQMLAFRAGADKPWRDAVENELIVAHILNGSHADPRKAVQDAISWNVQVALDPAVSSDAQALIERGRASLLREIGEALPAMRAYASKNPKHYFDGFEQDPHGVHAWLDRNERAHGIGENTNG